MDLDSLLRGEYPTESLAKLMREAREHNQRAVDKRWRPSKSA
jgi:hypothetical protein